MFVISIKTTTTETEWNMVPQYQVHRKILYEWMIHMFDNELPHRILQSKDSEEATLNSWPQNWLKKILVQAQQYQQKE